MDTPHVSVSLSLANALLNHVNGGIPMQTPKTVMENNPKTFEEQSLVTLLNAQQAIHYKWTEVGFAEFLDRRHYFALPDRTRIEVETFWRTALEVSKRSWDNYLWYSPPEFEYIDVDYERFEAINCLACLKSKQAVSVVLRISTETVAKDNRERWMATRALGMIGDNSVVPDVIHLIYHYNVNVRLCAQIALVQMTGHNFESNWLEWGEWWNSTYGTPAFSSTRVQWQLPPDATPEDREQSNNVEYLKREEAQWAQDRLERKARIAF